MNKSKKIISTLGSYVGFKSRKINSEIPENSPEIPVFESTWKTDNPGTSNDNQISLPLEETGTYDFLVKWGDGSSDTITVWNQAEVTHTYSAAGIYTVRITGTINGWRFNNGGDKLKFVTIESWGELLVGNSGNYFHGCENLIINAEDVLDVSNVTIFYDFFCNCKALISVDVSLWNVGNGVDFTGMMQYCESLTTFDVSNWNVSNAKCFAGAFYKCMVLSSIDVSLWDVSNVTDFRSVFGYCSLLTEIDVSLWNVGNVTNFYSAFIGCTSLVILDVSLWVVSNVVDFEKAFYDCRSLETIDVSLWDVSSVATMCNMFYNCTSLDNIEVSLWNVSSVSNFSSTFIWCSGITDIGVDNWVITSVTNMENMFQGVTLATQCYDAILIAWEAQAVQNNVKFHAGNSKYILGGAAEAARTALINDHIWTITDGGGI